MTKMIPSFRALFGHVDVATNPMLQDLLLAQDNKNVLQSSSFYRDSILGHIVIRDRENADSNLIIDYFSSSSRFNDMFPQRFNMSLNLFLHIVEAVKDHDVYFQ